MFKLDTRTTISEGKATLHTRLKVEGKSIWVNLRLLVENEEWNKRKGSDKKIQNYLLSLGYTEKFNEIELGI